MTDRGLANQSVDQPTHFGGDRALSRPALVFAALVLVAIVIRLVNLGGDSLWLDEAATVAVASQDLDLVLAGEGVVEHPPGYYALIHGILEVDRSETAVRLPSVIASGLAVGVVFLLGRRLLNAWVGLAGAALLALAPIDVWYGQEARQPALAALILFASLGAMVWLPRVGSVLGAAGLFLGLWVDFVFAAGWVAAGAVWVFWWWSRDRGRVWAWSGATIVGGAVALLVLGDGFIGALESLLGTDAVWYGSVFRSNPVTSNPIGLLGFMFLAVLGVMWVGNRLTASARGASWVWLVVFGYGAVALALVIPRAYSVKKVLVIGWPLVVLIVAALIDQWLGESQRNRVLAALGAVSLIAVVAVHATPRDDWRGAVDYIHEQTMPGTAVWVSGEPWGKDAYHYYTHGRSDALPVHNDPVPSDTLTDETGVWLITKRRPQDPVPSIPAEAWFDEHWDLVEEKDFYRLGVKLYREP